MTCANGTYAAAILNAQATTAGVTGCSIGAVLRASHIKSWRDLSDAERLDPANGELLSANFDSLFDNGLISSFSDGVMPISPSLSSRDRKLLGLPRSLRLPFADAQRRHLAYHRAQISLI